LARLRVLLVGDPETLAPYLAQLPPGAAHQTATAAEARLLLAERGFDLIVWTESMSVEDLRQLLRNAPGPEEQPG
jgi:hypothetical protein